MSRDVVDDVIDLTQRSKKYSNWRDMAYDKPKNMNHDYRSPNNPNRMKTGDELFQMLTKLPSTRDPSIKTIVRNVDTSRVIRTPGMASYVKRRKELDAE